VLIASMFVSRISEFPSAISYMIHYFVFCKFFCIIIEMRLGFKFWFSAV
jgi:hypothetical protein